MFISLYDNNCLLSNLAEIIEKPLDLHTYDL